MKNVMKNVMKNTNTPKNKKKFNHNLFKPKKYDIIRILRKESVFVQKLDEIVYIESFRRGVPKLIFANTMIGGRTIYNEGEHFDINAANYYQKETRGIDDDYEWKFELIDNIGKVPIHDLYVIISAIAPEHFV